MTRIQPFPAPCAEKARAALPRPAGTAVFMLTHEARSALCGRFGLEDSQLDRALGLLGAARVEDPDCLLYTSPSPRDRQKSRMPSSA